MPPKKRLSAEYTMLSILEHMCIHTRDKPVSKYYIITKVPGISTQRPDRVAEAMEILEKNNYIKAINTPNAVFYQVTEKGIEAYTKWIKDFLDFVREANKL